MAQSLHRAGALKTTVYVWLSKNLKSIYPSIPTSESQDACAQLKPRGAPSPQHVPLQGSHLQRPSASEGLALKLGGHTGPKSKASRPTLPKGELVTAECVQPLICRKSPGLHVGGGGKLSSIYLGRWPSKCCLITTQDRGLISMKQLRTSLPFLHLVSNLKPLNQYRPCTLWCAEFGNIKTDHIQTLETMHDHMQ